MNDLEFKKDKSQIIAKGKTYQLIPECTKDNQVLTYNGSDIIWTDEKKLDTLTYGISWVPEQEDSHCKRIGNMNMHRELPIQSGMKGCVFNCIDNEVVYWLDEDDWDFKSEILATTSGSMTGTTLRISKLSFPLTLEDTGSCYQVIWSGGKFKIQATKIEEYIYEFTAIDADYDSLPYGVFSFKLKEASRLDGYDGEVMIHIPEFWIKSYESEDENWVRISPTYIDDSWEHQKECYLSAYRNAVLMSVPSNMGYLSRLSADSCVSIVNTNTYCRGSFNNSSRDSYLTSDPTKTHLGKPSCNNYSWQTGCGRYYVRNRILKGYKHLMTYQELKNIMYWLAVIEYSNFNLLEDFNDSLTDEGFRQGGLGQGLNNIWDSGTYWDSYNNYSIVTQCGFGNRLGNKTGLIPIQLGDIQADVIRYRGIDNYIGDCPIECDNNISSITSEGLVTQYISKYPVDSIPTDLENIEQYSYTTASGQRILEFQLGTHANIIPKNTKAGIPANIYKSMYFFRYNSRTPKLIAYGGAMSYINKSIFNGLYYVGSGDSILTFFSVYTPK